jgi:hypothetical protein
MRQERTESIPAERAPYCGTFWRYPIEIATFLRMIFFEAMPCITGSTAARGARGCLRFRLTRTGPFG